ncbi:Gtr1/RagA G protein conserved region-domain-containing protein [Limtongia smithiae]|uniref:Gtr1/RagA G protein conserved region-domain-containing protein n=1 Tax=Limtongia smithiae TaxID=1125753 RepID=UPI0034CF9031
MSAYMDDPAVEEHPRQKIAILGPRKSGKSSICQVLFNKMPALDTIYIDSTLTPTEYTFSAFVDFTIIELPYSEDEDTFQYQDTLKECASLIYVIDSQAGYHDAVYNMQFVIEQAMHVRPTINIEVFVHKVDGLSEDFRFDQQRVISQRVTDELMDSGFVNVSLSFYQTSIYDSTIYDAMSRVVQKQIPQIGTLENLLNVLCQHSGIDRALLFDIKSKLLVAEDANYMSMPMYEVSIDFIDITIGMNSLYVSDKRLANSAIENGSEPRRQLAATSRMNNGDVLHLQQMVKGLTLVCLVKSDSLPKIALVEYNIELFREAMEQLWMLG